MAIRPSPAHLLLLYSRAYWNVVMLTQFWAVFGFIWTTVAELSSGNETLRPTKPELFTLWLIKEQIYEPCNRRIQKKNTLQIYSVTHFPCEQ